MEFEQVLNELQADLKGFITKAQEEQASTGTVLAETKSAIDEINNRIDSLQVEIERKDRSEKATPLIETLKANEQLQKMIRPGGDVRRSGPVTIELSAKQVADILTKTTVTTTAVGWPTHGVMPTERMPGIVAEARRQLRMRDVIPGRATNFGEIYFVKVNSGMSDGQPQIETSPKHENAVTFTTASERVKTIASWIPASKQVLADWGELESFLRTSLAYYVDKELDEQILAGAGTGENLNGIITQATAFNTALLPSPGLGWNLADVIGTAIQQIGEANEVNPTTVVMHTRDWWKIQLTKDGEDRYLFGGPNSMQGPSMWGLTVVVTNAISAGTFLVGAATPDVVEMRYREGMTVEISTEHEDYFVRNMVAIRAELRAALVARRPQAWIYGSLASSPA